MNILGLNPYHSDSSACLMVDGKIVAAAEEERFRRIKHWAGLPTSAINYVLEEAHLSLSDIDHIAINRKPRANNLRRLGFVLTHWPHPKLIAQKIKNIRSAASVKETLQANYRIEIKAEVHHVEHHLAHLASAYLVSGFNEAACISIDGFGDFASTALGFGQGSNVKIDNRVYFPHSLGIFYSALTQFLGFPHYGDEYKVMGLAPYGEPSQMAAMRDIVRVQPDGTFKLNLDYFTHHSAGLDMVWQGGMPVIGPVYSQQLVDRLGPVRASEEPIEQRHKDLAASMQAMFEEAFFAMATSLFEQTKLPRLCLAGGCGYNSVANGMVFDHSPFRDLYIQAAAGDAGGAIGAAYWVWNQELRNARSFVMDHAYWGPAYDDGAIDDAVAHRRADLDAAHCAMERVRDERELCRRTAAQVAAGDVVGWFQGRMEWGPRALGNRSIVCDPRRADMKSILNQKIKRRESFRPFAPSVLREAVGEWFETDYDVPFMLQVYQIREAKRALIPAVTHVNGSGRLQSVTEPQNPRYYHLIEAFRDATGIPIVLNTSFNENEPVVNTPGQALDCFLRTKMDLLVMGDLMIERTE